jgi:predicted transcriptional regulator
MVSIKKEDLIDLIDKGITYKEIAEIIGVSYSSIRRYCFKYKLKSKINDLKKERVDCLNCGIEVIGNIKENKKFCNHSCSATYNNKKRKVENKCIECELEIPSINKFCSKKCHRLNEMKKMVSNGNAKSITMKKYLIINYGNKCMECGWCEFNKTSGKVPIELEHIDGNSENNNLDNLKLLCPNCHSLTPTYKGLNKGNGRYKRRERYKEGKSY